MSREISYFLPIFDLPKINIVFSNTIKVRSCIKNYSFEKKKQNACFVWNAASASDFRHYFFFTYDKYKNKVHIYNKFFSIFLVRLATQSVNHTSLKSLEILFKNAVISTLHRSIYQYALVSYIFKLIFVLYFPESASRLPFPNSLWEGGGRICA